MGNRSPCCRNIRVFPFIAVVFLIRLQLFDYIYQDNDCFYSPNKQRLFQYQLIFVLSKQLQKAAVTLFLPRHCLCFIFFKKTTVFFAYLDNVSCFHFSKDNNFVSYRFRQQLFQISPLTTATILIYAQTITFLGFPLDITFLNIFRLTMAVISPETRVILNVTTDKSVF